MYKTMSNMHIMMHLLWSSSLQSQKVSIKYSEPMSVTKRFYIAIQEHSANLQFQKFCQQLFHSSLSTILSTLKPAMMNPEVVIYGDGHFHCMIYSLGPYIANYEEQVLLACIVQRWYAR